MATPDFNTLAEEDKRLLRLARERYGFDVIPLAALRGGRTGALLYLVSVNSESTQQVEHFILKIDRVHPKSPMDEIRRHRLACDDAPVAFAREHIADLTYEVRHEGRIAIFYAIAGQSLHDFRPLASYEKQSRVGAIFAATNDYLLAAWNACRRVEQAVHPQELLARWLGYRLGPEGNLGRFLEESCGVPPDSDGLLVAGEVFPNPIAYGRQRERWGRARPIDIVSGLQHGDLNIGNILVKFVGDTPQLAGYYLIDFALYQNEMPLLYDQRYLEMSYLVRELERSTFAKWATLVRRLAEEGTPDPQRAPVELAGPCAVVNCGREAFARWLETAHPSLTDDLWGQFWLAAVAAGLNFCNKAAIPDRERFAGLMFAAAHLRRYCKQFGLPPPQDVRPLPDPDRQQEIPAAESVAGMRAEAAGDAMAAPTGTLTLLVTGLTDSASLWEKFPRDMGPALARHNALLEEAAKSFGGYVFERRGDGFGVAFPAAVAAAQAAIAAQRALLAEPWGRTGPLRVRMALHTGEAQADGAGYLGPVVNRATRLHAVAHGGQILFSDETWQQLKVQSLQAFAWHDLGQHWLPDLQQPEHIYQIIAADLPADFPPLPTVGLQTRNLPEQATPFVGRRRELAQLAELLAEHRLVTLTGPGGIGKTRLALAAAEAQGDNFRQGAYFVPLLPLNSATAIVPAIANVLGLTFLEGRPLDAQLFDYLRPRQLLLVLDNMEHLLPDEGPDVAAGATLALVEAMLAAAPALKILVTSRERLCLPQEQLFAVTGLPHGWLPYGNELEAPAAGEDDAIALFQMRAQRVDAGFSQLSAADVSHARRICRLVEGMPLAIELAAAQLRLLAPGDIANEIEHNLDVLDAGLRGAAARHSSVRVVFDASWRQLGEDARLILARLAEFRGGFTHQAAASVAGANVTDLATLHDKSLLQRGGDGRFTLHALIQMFAAEKLGQQADEMARAQELHYRYYRTLLRQAVERWRVSRDVDALDIARPEVDNLRAGWAWALGRVGWDETTAYLDDLWQFFKVRGRLPEAMEVLDQAIAAGQAARPPADVRHLAHWERLLGQAHLWLSQLREGDEHFRRTLALLGWPVPGSQAGLTVRVLAEFLVQGLHRLLPRYFIGRLAAKRNEAGEAFVAYERLGNRAVVENETMLGFYSSFRSLNLAEAAGLRRMMARAYGVTGLMYGLMPVRSVAEAYFRRAEAIARQEDSPEVWETVSRVAGFYFGAQGEWAIAATHARRAARAAEELGWLWEKETNWVVLLTIAYAQGDFARAGLCAAHQHLGHAARRRGFHCRRPLLGSVLKAAAGRSSRPDCELAAAVAGGARGGNE